jgi:hypothetical protein
MDSTTHTIRDISRIGVLIAYSTNEQRFDQVLICVNQADDKTETKRIKRQTYFLCHYDVSIK